MMFTLAAGFLLTVVSAFEFKEDLNTLFEDSPCAANDTTIGVCKQLLECPGAAEELRRHERPRLCGFNGTIPVVCCEGSPNTDHNVALEQCQLYRKIVCHDNSLINMSLTFVEGNTSKPTPESVNLEEQYLTPIVHGGEPSQPKEFPFMALIGYGEEDDISWNCGGSLVSSFYVLSAGRCTYPSKQIGIAKWIRLGDLDTSTDLDDARPQTFKIVKHINHPDYKPPQLYNDIALYKLNVSAEFNNYVRPNCLYPVYDHWEDKATVARWGRIESAGPTSKYLLKANITLLTTQDCASFSKNNSNQLPRGIDPLSMICAGETDGLNDTCQGDSGGSLVVQGLECMAFQIGVTSFGRQCGLPNSPGIYTRVAHFLSWIESVIWNTKEDIFIDLSGSTTSS